MPPPTRTPPTPTATSRLIVKEASIFGEDVLIATLELSLAKAGSATKSVTRGLLIDWWKEGLKYVRVID